MVIRYTRNFNVGRDTHQIEIYTGYSKEEGKPLGGPQLVREDTVLAKCLAGLKIPAEQKATLKQLARDRQDGFVFENGRYLQVSTY